MIILDTNVVSELMKPQPDPAVYAWANGLERSTIFATAPTVYEIAFGIARLPEGARKERLRAAWEVVRNEFLPGRILAMDEAAAAQAGEMKVLALKRGGSIDICDLLIGGIAASAGGLLATRAGPNDKLVNLQLVEDPTKRSDLWNEIKAAP